MKAKLHLTSDSLKVNKGDCFTVTWGSETPESLYLIVDDGDSVQKYPVADNGSKTCLSTRAKKDIAVTLAATFNGKKQTVSVKVKVKDKQKFQIWKERMQAKISVSKAQFAYAWSAMKTWQKIVYIIGWALPLALVIALIVR